MLSLEQRIDLHKAFWDGTPMSEPLVSFRIGDYFFANKFKANRPLLVPGTIVSPDMIHVDDFLQDYLDMYNACEATGQTAFFNGDPCTGFPWMEAMLGAPVIGSNVSFITHPIYSDITEMGPISYDPNTPWARKYMEFANALTKLSAGRFPVGQPILRGFSDCVGSLIGQIEMVCDLIDEPRLISTRFMEVAQLLRDFIEDQNRYITDFHNGYSMGFYHLWAPGKVIWYQDDLSALMSPHHYEPFIRQPSELVCNGYDYTLVHLHPNSFFHLDGILSLHGLKAIEINKDVNGPTIHEMLPVFRRVINADKRLVIWGDLTKDEIRELTDELPHKALFLNIITPTQDDAADINAIIHNIWK